jgi:hypothetical protein
VGLKPNHCKSANGSSQHVVEYQPSEDHSAKLTSGQSKAYEYLSAREQAARKTQIMSSQMATSSQVKFNSNPFVIWADT